MRTKVLLVVTKSNFGEARLGKMMWDIIFRFSHFLQKLYTFWIFSSKARKYLKRSFEAAPRLLTFLHGKTECFPDPFPAPHRNSIFS